MGFRRVFRPGFRRWAAAIVVGSSREGARKRTAEVVRLDFSKRARPIAAFVVASIAVLGPAAPSVAQVTDRSALIRKLLPSVVEIHTRRAVDQTPPGQDSTLKEATGSGFVISADGYIVTNRHVIDDAYDVSVWFGDGERYGAHVVGKGRTYDLALLKITPAMALRPVPFGNSDAVEVGQPVLVIGSPFGLGVTVTAGIVSAVGRDLNFTHFDQFLQTDAAINRGNSGGPMFNLDGEVVGINTALFSPGKDSGFVGVGYAIPATDAAMLVPLLKQYGFLKAGSLRIYVQPVTAPIAQALGIAKRGVIVASIAADGPAAGKLSVGGVLTSVDGRPIDSLLDYYRRVSVALERSIEFEVLRGGALMRVALMPVQWAEEVQASVSSARLKRRFLPTHHPCASASRPQPSTTRTGAPTGFLKIGQGSSSPRSCRPPLELLQGCRSAM